MTLFCLVHSIRVLIFLRAFFPYGTPHLLTVSLPTTHDDDDDDDNFIRLSIYCSSSYVNDTRMDLHTHVHKYLSVCTYNAHNCISHLSLPSTKIPTCVCVCVCLDVSVIND